MNLVMTELRENSVSGNIKSIAERIVGNPPDSEAASAAQTAKSTSAQSSSVSSSATTPIQPKASEPEKSAASLSSSDNSKKKETPKRKSDREKVSHLEKPAKRTRQSLLPVAFSSVSSPSKPAEESANPAPPKSTSSQQNTAPPQQKAVSSLKPHAKQSAAGTPKPSVSSKQTSSDSDATTPTGAHSKSQESSNESDPVAPHVEAQPLVNQPVAPQELERTQSVTTPDPPAVVSFKETPVVIKPELEPVASVSMNGEQKIINSNLSNNPKWKLAQEDIWLPRIWAFHDAEEYQSALIQGDLFMSSFRTSSGSSSPQSNLRRVKLGDYVMVMTRPTMSSNNLGILFSIQTFTTMSVPLVSVYFNDSDTVTLPIDLICHPGDKIRSNPQQAINAEKWLERKGDKWRAEVLRAWDTMPVIERRDLMMHATRELISFPASCDSYGDGFTQEVLDGSFNGGTDQPDLGPWEEPNPMMQNSTSEQSQFVAPMQIIQHDSHSKRSVDGFLTQQQAMLTQISDLCKQLLAETGRSPQFL